MAIQPGVWGIDLGQCALKALRLENHDGQVTATAFDYVEHPKILSQPDADPDELTREALEKFLSRNQLRGDQVAISVPGQSGLARFVKLPPVEEKKIVDIVRFEAKQQIPFNLDEVVWDYQKIGSGVVTDGFAMETEIGLFAMKRDLIGRYLQHFKDVNVEVHLVQMAPLCLCNFTAFDLLNRDADDAGGEGEAVGKKRCIVTLDIGADSSNLVVTDGFRIIWQRPIPLGGNHFTRALTKDLKLTFAKAEHLKRNASKSGPELKKILTSLRPVLNDFVGEVQRSLGYFTNTHRDAQVEYMMGLGNAFRLPGLQRYLQEKLQLEVRKLQKLNRLAGDSVITAPAFTENVLSFAVAYGLGLQGLKTARLQTNLLPPEIRVERLVRAKKPWAATAAAALLLGVAGLALGYSLEYRAYKNPLVDEAQKGAKSAVDAVKKGNTKFDEKKNAIKKEEDAVRSIVAGQDERLNWIMLNQFIHEAVPHPDGKNLPPEGAKRYWTPEAEKAYVKFLQQIASGMPSADPNEDLINFNIEAVNSSYINDLPGFWNSVKEQVKARGMVRPLKHWDESPKDGGWVIELRGYTAHKDGMNFVLRTLVENLAYHGGIATQSDEKPAAEAAPGAKKAGAADKKASSAESKKPEPAASTPVIGRISHIVLYRVSQSGTDTGNVDLIHRSELSQMAGGGDKRGNTPSQPGAGRPTPQKPARDGGKTDGDKPASGKDLSRTEFIVLFIWKESTPSDQLRTMKLEKSDAPPGGPGQGRGGPQQMGKPGMRGR